MPQFPPLCNADLYLLTRLVGTQDTVGANLMFNNSKTGGREAVDTDLATHGVAEPILSLQGGWSQSPAPSQEDYRRERQLGRL